MQFSQNQVQQLYVVNKLSETLSDPAAKGEATFHAKDKEGYVEYKGAKGTYRTDMVLGPQILSITVTSGKAKSQVRYLKQWTVKVSDNAIAAIGQVCILRLSFRNWIGMSDFDTYTKDVAVKIVKGMTKEAFYTQLAKAIRQSFAREYDKVITATSDATSVIIKEVGTDLDEWQRGVKSVAPINLTVSADMITVSDGVEETWVDTTKANADNIDAEASNEFGTKIKATNSATTVGNAKAIADLEYFCAGNRGDMYRNVGWPNVIPTEYLITNTDNDTSYDIVNVHYYFVGAGVQSAKSEKDMTFVCKHDAAITVDPENPTALSGKSTAETLAKKFKALTGFNGEVTVVADNK